MKNINQDLLLRLQNLHEESDLQSRLSLNERQQVKDESFANDPSKIHNLYQDLYLTDLKNDLSSVHEDLCYEKKQSLLQQ
jgi:hypothetical protein